MKIVKISAAIIAAGMTLFFYSPSALAQEAVTFGDDARYIEVVFVAYKPGKAAEAYGLINNHFAPAGDDAGLPGPVIIHFQTGPWNAAMHWRLDDGLAELEWRISPDNVKFRASLVNREGSEEAAQAILDQYTATIARTSRVIGHRHVSEDEE